jgi:dihydropteroate synthase
VQQAEKMVAEGAAILDVGGYSSRPGASEVSIQEELDRVLPVLEKLKDFTDAFLSIDTFRSKVAAEAVQAGANMVNDISAGEEDDAMLATVARLGVPYIAMHKQGKPKTMQTNPQYTDVVGDVLEYLQKKITQCKVAGIAEVIIDPGFGFGKTTLHNYALLKNLNELTRLNAPILAGISRKSMINKVLETSPEEALNGTTFLHAYALQGGASILRVHDVKEALECVKLYSMLNKGIV